MPKCSMKGCGNVSLENVPTCWCVLHNPNHLQALYEQQAGMVSGLVSAEICLHNKVEALEVERNILKARIAELEKEGRYNLRRSSIRSDRRRSR